MDGIRRGGQLRRGGQSARRRQQLKPGETMLSEKLGRLGGTAVAKDDRAARVTPDEVAVHSAAITRGLMTGRSLGSTSARRCS